MYITRTLNPANSSYFSRRILATQYAEVIYSTTIEPLSLSSMGKPVSVIYPSGVQALNAARKPTVGTPTRRHFQRITLLYRHQRNPGFTRTPWRNTGEHRQLPILHI